MKTSQAWVSITQERYRNPSHNWFNVGFLFSMLVCLTIWYCCFDGTSYLLWLPMLSLSIFLLLYLCCCFIFMKSWLNTWHYFHKSCILILLICIWSSSYENSNVLILNMVASFQVSKNSTLIWFCYISVKKNTIGCMLDRIYRYIFKVKNYYVFTKFWF